MATMDVPLKTESALLEEPERQPVLPKSYADVVQEEAPAGEKNGTHEPNGTSGTMNTDHTNSTAAVPEIAGMGASAVEKDEVVKEDSPQSEKDEPQNGYAVDV
jgi:hypothetical protein